VCLVSDAQSGSDKENTSDEDDNEKSKLYTIQLSFSGKCGDKGLGSLTINFCPANMEKTYFTNSFEILQLLQNITYFL